MRNKPKHFRVEPSNNAIILSAVSSIKMLFEEDVREECDLLIDQVSQDNATMLPAPA